MVEGRNTLTGYDASEGALYVLFAAVLAGHPGVPPFFAVDNFDHSLNPLLARALVERFCAWVRDAPSVRQVLLTTHNPLVLDGLDLTDDSVRLFAVDRREDGHTDVQRIVVDSNLLKRAGEGWTLSRLWVMGEIGGIPNV
jgi:predicted ATPase